MNREPAAAPDDLPPSLVESYLPSGMRTQRISDSNWATHSAVLSQWRLPIAPPSDDPSATEAVPRAGHHAPHTAFKLKQLIGAGGMGEVWEARQLSLGRMVAVKRIRPERLGDSDRELLQIDFRSEAMIAGRLEHPNIVPVHDLGVDEAGSPVIAMKLVRGRPWGDILLEDYAKLAVPDFLAKHLPTFIAMGNAVGFAHSRGVVHRDLKPTQVMVGEYGEVLLMDWGLAIVVGDPKDGAQTSFEFALPTALTASNPSGTVAFMAPEQTLSTAERVGTWTDVYLLGGTLYYLLTGRLPHEGADAKATFFKAATGAVVPPAQAAPWREIPPELAVIAMEAMAPEITARIPSAEALVARVQDFLSGTSRRREADAIVQATAAKLAQPGLAYRDFAECQAALARAKELHPGSPATHALSNALMMRYAESAVAEGDLMLARVQAEQIEDAAARSSAMAKVEAAQAHAAAQRRQQRQLRIGVAALAATIFLGLGGFALVLRGKNAALAHEKAAAVDARARAEENEERAQRQRALAARRSAENQDMVRFMIEDLVEALDLETSRDRVLRDRIAERVRNQLAATDFSGEDGESAVSIGMNLAAIAQAFTDLALLDDAEKLALRAREMLKASLPAGDYRLGEPLYALGEIAMERSQFDEAEKLLREAAAIQEKGESKEAKKDLSITLNDLGGIASTRQRFGEAEALMRRSNQLAEEALGPEHPSVMLGISNLALVLWDQGRRDEAVAETRRAIALQEKYLGPEHKDLGTTLGNLAQYLSEMEQYDEADKAFQRASAIVAKAHGNDHPAMAVLLNNFGLMLLNHGRAADAEKYFRRALAIDTKAYGDVHTLVGIRYNNLGSALEELGKMAEAEECYRKSLAIAEELLGPDHPDTSNSLHNLGLILLKLDKRAEADKCLDRARAILEKAAGADHPVVKQMREIHDRRRREADAARM